MSSLDAYLRRIRVGNHALARLMSDEAGNGRALHTPAEIAQQPWLWRDTVERMRARSSSLAAFLEDANAFDAADAPIIALTGAGTSDHVGVTISDLLRGVFAGPTYSWPTTRITACPDAYLDPDHDYIIFHFARSGQSPESRAVLEMALRHIGSRAHHIIVTCNADGDLARLARSEPDRARVIVLHNASNDLGLAMTSSFTNLVLAGQSMAHLDQMDRFAELVDRMAEAGEYLIDTYADEIYRLASPDTERMLFMGNLDQYGAALESALKTQELTAGRIFSAGMDTLALRHGPVSAVTPDTVLCFLLSASAHTRRYELDVLRQYRDRFAGIGARTLVVCASKPKDAPEGVTYIEYDPEERWQVPPYYEANLSVLVGQLFGLFACRRLGLDIDNPASETALYSRTVEGVRLHDFQPDSMSDPSHI